MPETIEQQETELGRTQPSLMVTGISRPSLPSTLPVQELEHDREEDCCMQHALITSFQSMAGGES